MRCRRRAGPARLPLPAASPVHAAPGAQDADSPLEISAEPDYYLPGPGEGVSMKFVTRLTAATPVEDVSLTVDATDLRGTAKIGEDDCPEDPARPYVFHCDVGTVEDTETVVAIKVNTAKGAERGDHGTLRYSATAAAGSPRRPPHGCGWVRVSPACANARSSRCAASSRAPR